MFEISNSMSFYSLDTFEYIKALKQLKVIFFLKDKHFRETPIFTLTHSAKAKISEFIVRR